MQNNNKSISCGFLVACASVIWLVGFLAGISYEHSRNGDISDAPASHETIVEPYPDPIGDGAQPEKLQ